MKRAMSNEFLHALAAVGSPSDVRDGVRGYLEAGATSPCVEPDRAHGLRRHAARGRPERVLSTQAVLGRVDGLGRRRRLRAGQRGHPPGAALAHELHDVGGGLWWAAPL